MPPLSIALEIKKRICWVKTSRLIDFDENGFVRLFKSQKN